MAYCEIALLYKTDKHKNKLYEDALASKELKVAPYGVSRANEENEASLSSLSKLTF